MPSAEEEVPPGASWGSVEKRPRGRCSGPFPKWREGASKWQRVRTPPWVASATASDARLWGQRSGVRDAPSAIHSESERFAWAHKPTRTKRWPQGEKQIQPRISSRGTPWLIATTEPESLGVSEVTGWGTIRIWPQPQVDWSYSTALPWNQAPGTLLPRAPGGRFDGFWVYCFICREHSLFGTFSTSNTSNRFSGQAIPAKWPVLAQMIL